MGKRNRFNRKGKSDSLVALTTKKKFRAPALILENVYFTWGTVSDAVRYAKVVDKLKESVAVHFHNQATVAARELRELQAPPVFVKTDRPIHLY